MAIDVVIPKLGMTMKEGTIVEWTVADGTPVNRDDVVFILTTDKLETEVTAEAAGILRHRAQAGETHPVSAVVGVILAEGEAMAEGGKGVNGMAPSTAPPAALPPESPPPQSGDVAGNGSAAALSRHTERLVASPYARRLARGQNLDLASLSGTGPGGRIVAADVVAASDRGPGVRKLAADVVAASDRGPSATPVARRLAERLNVDLGALAGTGPGGRITKDDVEKSARCQATSVRASTAIGVPIRGMRKIIADRMHASLREMAQLTMGMEVDLTDAVTLRRQLIDAWEGDGVRVSITDLVCRSVVMALEAHPGLNASVESEAIQLHPEVHLGLAVAVPDGLLVPVIAGADRRSLKDLSAEAARVSVASRDGTIGVDDLEGATFTVTALGSSGIDFFTPVINPPNVAILGVGRVHDGVRWEGDRPLRRQVITLSLTIDHRAVDGAPGAAFLAAVRSLLESPHRLLA